MALPVKPFVKSKLLAGQTNGRLNANVLENVPGQAGGAVVTLVKPAARSWRALCDAAKRAGHVLKAGYPTNSYRPYADQRRIFVERYTRTPLAGRPSKLWDSDGDGVKERWYQKPGTAVAAVPGTSNHGWASAVDTGEERDGDVGSEPFDTATLEWLKVNAARFGWSWEIQSEPWHLRYNAGDAVPKAVLDYEASLKPQPDPEEDEDEMPTAYIWFKDNRTPTTKLGAYRTTTEKPVVAGTHLYAVTAGVGVRQTDESFAGVMYLHGLAKTKPLVIGSKSKPETVVAANGTHGVWFSGSTLLDGPLAGIKK